jgi:group I intron endonuclease
MQSGIYKILNWTNGKVYVGSASYLRKRISDHKCQLIKNKHDNQYLQNAWNKYGEVNFTFSIIEHCSKDKLLEREQFWIDSFQSANEKFGYNIAKIAGNTAGIRWTEEVRAKQIAARTGKKRPQEEKDKISASMKGIKNRLGTKHNNQTKALMSAVHTGIKHSEETRKKISENCKGKPKPRTINVVGKVLTFNEGDKSWR